MKNTKRIIGFLLLVLLVATVAITAIAETVPEYTGKVNTMSKKLELIGNTTDLFDRENAISDAQAYLERIDPALPEYEGFVASLDGYELLFAGEYVDIILSEAAPAAKHETLDSLNLWLTEHPFADTTSVIVNDNGTPDDPADDVVYSAGDFIAKLTEVETNIAEAYLAEAKAATEADDKHLILDCLEEFIRVYAPAESQVYNAAAVESENFECAKLYLGAINAATGTAKSSAALRRVRGFMADHPFSNTISGYGEFESSLALKSSVVNEAVSKAKKELELKAHVDDYDRTPVVHLDFNRAATDGKSVYNIGRLTPENYIDGEVVYSHIGEDSGSDGQNGYYTISFGRASKYSRTYATILSSITDSVVFECDLTTFDRLPDKNIIFENGSVSVNGRSLTRTYLQITPDGNILDGKKNVILEDAVVPGQWMHISMVLNQITNVVDIYIDYEFMKSVDLAHTEGFTHVFERVIIGATPTVAGGSIALDNVRLYQGFAPRANDSYLSKTETEKFIFCTEQMQNSASFENDGIARVEYYEEAASRISQYWDGKTYITNNVSVRKAVDSFYKFEENDLSSLISIISDDNLHEYLALTKKLSDIDIGEATYSDRVYFADLTDSFVAQCGNGKYITAGEEYDKAREAVLAVRTQLQKEDALQNFISAVDNFYIATTISDMKYYLKLADELLAITDISITMGGGFPSFDAAYSDYFKMDEVLAEEIMIDNSKLLLAILKYVTPYDTEEKWNESFELLKSYVTNARNIINGGNYDPYYRDLGAFVEKFAPMSEYFYVRMQDEHIDYLSSELQRYEASDIFFERYGILVKLREYIATSDVNVENADIKALIERIESEFSALESDRDAYNELLASNTQKFVEKCQGLLGSVSYADMKAICNEAGVYYYAMNVTSAAAQDAIAVYSARCEEIKAIEANAETFVLTVALFDLPETDVLKNIVAASECIPMLETSCEGAEAALARYNTEILLYNSGVENTNAEILSTVKAAAALSNNGERSPLVTVIMKNADIK